MYLCSIQVSLVEIPSYVFATLTVDHIGRKSLYVFCIMLTGVGCLSAAYLEDGDTAKTALCLVGRRRIFVFLLTVYISMKNVLFSGKFGAAAAFAIIFLFAGELYPTEIRSTAVGLCSTLARFGGIAAPQVYRKNF